MTRPKIDDELKLLTDFGETEAICAEVLDDPGKEDGVLLKVMTGARSRKASNVGSSITTAQKSAQPSSVMEQAIESEVTLSTILPA